MPKRTHPGCRSKAVSLADLTPAQAMAGLLGVKPTDLKKVAQAEQKKKLKK